MTTCEPGASEVFTHGFTFSPLARALRATRPAAISTEGLEVLVQLVMAAITTSPWPTSNGSCPSSGFTGTRAVSWPALPKSSARALPKAAQASDRSTRSCGRLGPASEPSTVEMSSSSVSVNTGSGASGSWNRP